MKWSRSGAAWAAATVVGVLLTFAPAVVGLRTLAHRDTDRFFRPLRTLVVEALHQGRLPLWNPYEAAGKPLFAEGVHFVLHPVSLLGALLAPASMDLLILASLVLAALGAFVLSRGLGASPPAAAAAGLAFGLSGYTVSMTGNLVFLVGLASLPWQVAGAHAAGAGRPFGPVAAALGCACAFLSGDAQVALVGGAAGLALAAAAGGWRGALRAVVGLGVGVLLAGVQIASTQAFLERTFRSLEMPPEDRFRWALAPARLLEWAVPGLLRGPLAEEPRTEGGVWVPIGFAESIYLGVPILAAAALGAWRAARVGDQARRQIVVLVGAAVLVLWLAMGHHLGARQALDWVPVWNRFRFTEKLMGPLALLLTLLGALGVDAFGAARPWRGWTWGVAATGALAAAALGALVAAPAVAEGLAVSLDADLGRWFLATARAGLPHAALGAAAVLLVDRLRRPALRVAGLTAAVALAAAAGASAGAPLGDPGARRDPPPRLEADGPVPRVMALGPAQAGVHWKLAYMDAYARSLQLNLTPSVNVGARIDVLDAYCAFVPRRFNTMAMQFGMEGLRAMRRFGLTHLLVPYPPPPELGDLAAWATEGARNVEHDEDLGRDLWQVPHRPWAFFASRSVAREGPQEAFDELLGLVRREEHGTVVVEAPTPPPTAPGRVISSARGDARVRVEAEAVGPALLVVQDAYWPGWQATLDGRATEILAADVVVRAVRFPPGRHVLEMTYVQPGLALGLGLTAAGAALLLLLAGVGWRAARRAG